jgi:type VII secretion-associated protein (TIGR03931 family)
VTEVVIEVGPGTIRGPNDAPAEWVSAALDCIDDELALIDDRAIPVDDVWNDVMASVTGPAVDTAVVICPAWWPVQRLETVRRAAHTVATEVVLLERMALLREELSAGATIVELAPDIAVVSVSGAISAAVPLQGQPTHDAEKVSAAVGTPTAVVVDAPVGVLGAEILASTIADRMRAIGVPVKIVVDDHVWRTAASHRSPADVAVDRPGGFRVRRRLAALSGVLTVVVLCGAFAVTGEPHRGDLPMTLLVEGRVGVMVPVRWTARRITSGPGSARVQVVSSTDADVALNITQSAAPGPSTLAATADSLLAALEVSADGVFVDFNPSDRRGDRDAVTYLEVRPERRVAWTVVIDGSTRIAVGCESAPGREDLVREACDQAVRSSHEVRGTERTAVASNSHNNMHGPEGHR